MPRRKKKKNNIWLLLLLLAAVGAWQWFDGRKAAPASGVPAPSGSMEALCIPRMKTGEGVTVVRHEGYTAAFNATRQTPEWVAYVLTAEEADGQVPRKDRFVPDPDVPSCRVTTGDYKGSGYDRGHMAPAGDMKWSARAMEESFYLSNICPQNRNLNKGDWNDLEEEAREWARRYGAVCIVCGPVGADEPAGWIGDAPVAVPARFFKVFLRMEAGGAKAIGFLFANRAGSRPLAEYAVSVDRVEQETGLDFFASLPDEAEQAAESACRPGEWGL